MLILVYKDIIVLNIIDCKFAIYLTHQRGNIMPNQVRSQLLNDASARAAAISQKERMAMVKRYLSIIDMEKQTHMAVLVSSALNRIFQIRNKKGTGKGPKYIHIMLLIDVMIRIVEMNKEEEIGMLKTFLGRFSLDHISRLYNIVDNKEVAKKTEEFKEALCSLISSALDEAILKTANDH